MNDYRLAVEARSLGKKVRISLKNTFLKHQYTQIQFNKIPLCHLYIIQHYMSV